MATKLPVDACQPTSADATDIRRGMAPSVEASGENPRRCRPTARRSNSPYRRLATADCAHGFNDTEAELVQYWYKEKTGRTPCPRRYFKPCPPTHTADCLYGKLRTRTPRREPRLRDVRRPKVETEADSLAHADMKKARPGGPQGPCPFSFLIRGSC